MGFLMNSMTDVYSREKTIEVILTTQAVLKDPLNCRGAQQFQVLNLFLDTLVRKDPGVGIISGSADRWEVSANQAEYIFHLSEKARFHNGDLLTAEDVSFSFNRHLFQGSDSIVVSYVRSVLEKIEVVDRNTIKFILKGAYPPFLELLAMPGFGIISHKSTSEKIIGSGPFEFEESVGEKICLRKYKEYSFPVSNIDKFCFRIERDIEKTITLLNSNEVKLAIGSPVEVALSKKIKNDLIAHPVNSLVATHVFLNHHNLFLQKRSNRLLIRDILYKARDSKKILTDFDRPLNSFLPNGIMASDYYAHKITGTNLKISHQKIESQDKKLRIIFPYGIFLESAEKMIVESFNSVGFITSFISVKGKELLDPIHSGDFDLLFLPYQGVIPDPDGFLDLLDPNSMFKKAKLPTEKLMLNLKSVRFLANKSERLKSYENYLHEFEEGVHIIPFSQNTVPIIYNNSLELPDLNYSFQLNLRELKLKNE
jgi:peptide/nickel transport system substrate-binding protein